MSPVFAAAAPSTVDSTGDEPDVTLGTGACETAAGKCTLRAAIETADSDGTADTIKFNETVFTGIASEDEINLTEPLPTITEPVDIGGSVCAHPAGPSTFRFGPCVGLVASTGPAALVVESPDVRIDDLAIGGDTAGILANGAPGLVATDDLLGLRLNGEPSGSLVRGIILGPGSDGATIGREDLGSGGPDVIGNTHVGIYVHGASDTRIRSNLIGVGFDGVTPAPVAVGVGVVDSTGSEPDQAEDTEIGGVLSPFQAETPECDGACNVIEATETGIDLTGGLGEESDPETGPTKILANYLGLARDGLTPGGPSEGRELGIYAQTFSDTTGWKKKLTVGGASPTERNIIDGGRVGIWDNGTVSLEAVGNAFGWTGTQARGVSPTEAAISFASERDATLDVSQNSMKLSPGASGISLHGSGASIVGNTIEGCSIGIGVWELDSAENVIRKNSIAGAAEVGIRLLGYATSVTWA